MKWKDLLTEEWWRKQLKWRTSRKENEGKSESKSLLLQERRRRLHEMNCKKENKNAKKSSKSEEIHKKKMKGKVS